MATVVRSVTAPEATYNRVADSVGKLKLFYGRGDGESIFLTAGGRSGLFIWNSSNLSSQVTSDPQEGVYIAPNADPTGASGAWVRYGWGSGNGYDLNVLWFGALGIGSSNDDTSSFSACFSFSKEGSNIHIPVTSGYYYVGDVELPSGRNLVGYCKTRIYNPITSPDADVSGIGAIVYNTSDSDCLTFAGNNKVRDLIFHGNNKSLNGISNTRSLVNALFFDRVSMTNYANAYGSTLTVNNSRFINCHAAQNDIGFKNLVDSHVVHAEINANRIGVDGQTGSNDTTYTGCKNEFNDEENWRFNSVTSITVQGGVCDRAGHAGFRLTNAEIQITNVKTRRNGRFILADDECSHYFIEGNSSKVVISNMQTSSGRDDGGGGDLTPNYSVSLRGATVGSLVIVGGDASGAVTSPYSEFSSPSNAVITNCIGIEDFINTGNFQKKDARYINQKAYFSAIAASGSDSESLTDISIGTFSRQYRELVVYGRDTVTGATFFGKVPFVRSRESGSCTFVIYPAISESAPNAVGDNVADDVQISFSSIASDGSSYDLNVTNNSANQLLVNIEVL